ncbi:hypothetical protein DL93DRAFT_2090628 [Clavulina sp. PMI_390]|nr:hypothetical protein DL93DRAFT_2090628 [Clavulina sp. PMI_390]
MTPQSDTALRPVGYAMAAPPTGAIAIGLTIGMVAIGIVSIQVMTYSNRFWKDQKAVVAIINILFLCNLTALLLLGQGLYHSTVTRFHDGNLKDLFLAHRYTVMMAANIVLRAIVSYTVAMLTASLFKSRILGFILNVLIATRLGMTAFGVQAVYNSFGSKPHPKRDTMPRLLLANNLLSFGAECLVCILLCAAVFRAKMHGSRDPRIAQMAHHAIPSYFITVIWQLGFSSGVWYRSAFATASVGIPLGAVSNITLLSMLHANPSALGPAMWHHIDPANSILAPTKITDVPSRRGISNISSRTRELKSR